MISKRQAVISGMILILTAIILGALGAHALKGKIPTESLESFKTGVLYHLIMGALLLSLNFNPTSTTPKIFNSLLLIGVILFSGSIYALSTCMLWLPEGSLTFLGPVTPLGGLLMILSWTYLIFKYSTKEVESPVQN